MKQIAIYYKLTLLNQGNARSSLPYQINRVTGVPECHRLAELDDTVIAWVRKVCR